MSDLIRLSNETIAQARAHLRLTAKSVRSGRRLRLRT
jgi:hypothetical protein